MSQDDIISAISIELDRLYATFDTRVLAAAMLVKSTVVLRACHSAGAMKVEDVQAMIKEVTSDIYLPLPRSQVPPVITTDGGPPNLQ